MVNIHKIGCGPVRIGHHLDIVVSVRHETQAICRGNGVDRIVVSRHNEEVIVGNCNYTIDVSEVSEDED